MDASKAIMARLSGHGVKLILPDLLKGLEDDSWRTKAGTLQGGAGWGRYTARWGRVGHSSRAGQGVSYAGATCGTSLHTVMLMLSCREC